MESIMSSLTKIFFSEKFVQKSTNAFTVKSDIKILSKSRISNTMLKISSKKLCLSQKNLRGILNHCGF